jgi:hypothetical protein
MSSAEWAGHPVNFRSRVANFAGPALLFAAIRARKVVLNRRSKDPKYLFECRPASRTFSLASSSSVVIPMAIAILVLGPGCSCRCASRSWLRFCDCLDRLHRFTLSVHFHCPFDDRPFLAGQYWTVAPHCLHWYREVGLGAPIIIGYIGLRH